jgi:signal transduction histidine kinase
MIIILPLTEVAAQTETINHLKNEIAIATPDSYKLDLLLALCKQSHNLHPDTLLAYAGQARRVADKLGNKPASLKAEYFQAIGLTNNGLIDSALAVADRCLEKNKYAGNNQVLAGDLYNQKGRCYMRKNRYNDAVRMGYKVISTGEQSGDTLLQMQGKTLIGWANLEMGRIEESLQWHLQALNTTTDEEFRGKYSILYANLALNYNALGKTDSAFYYIKKAVNYSRKNENLFALSNSLAIEAQLYVRSGQPKLAEAPLKEVVAIRKQIGDPFYSVSDMAQLGIYYANNNQPQRGIAISEEGISIARKFHIDTKLLFLYNTLAENFKVAGDANSYAQTLEKIIELKDSVYQANSAQTLAEMRAKYELQKKENTIIRQQLDLNRKNYLVAASLFLTLILGGVGYLVFRNIRKRQRMRVDKIMKDEKKSALVAVKEAEEKERQRIAADLHDNLGAYAASMASNLDFIEMGQATGEGKDVYRQLRSNSQEIISQLRDTIWALNKDALALTSISDRIKLFVNRISPSYPHIKVDVFENIDNDVQLSSSQAFHLYRIMQEALSNALKHSMGTTIIISISSNVNWVVTIADNGRGISQATPPGSNNGNGLRNMQKRCADEGWKIEWLSTGAGTKVSVISDSATKG